MYSATNIELAERLIQGSEIYVSYITIYWQKFNEMVINLSEIEWTKTELLCLKLEILLIAPELAIRNQT